MANGTGRGFSPRKGKNINRYLDDRGVEMKRTWLQAVLFAVLFTVVYYAVQVGAGIYMTMSYVPDVINQYQSVSHLQSSVSFGYTAGPWYELLQFMLLFLIGIALYVVSKLVFRKIRK